MSDTACEVLDLQLWCVCVSLQEWFVATFGPAREPSMHALASALKQAATVIDASAVATALALSPDVVTAALRILASSKWVREVRAGVWQTTQLAPAVEGAELDPVSDTLPAYGAYIVRVACCRALHYLNAAAQIMVVCLC